MADGTFLSQKGSLSGGRIVSIGLNSCKLFQIIPQLEIQSEMLAEHILIADTQVAHPSGVDVDRLEQTVSCIGLNISSRNAGKRTVAEGGIDRERIEICICIPGGSDAGTGRELLREIVQCCQKQRVSTHPVGFVSSLCL